MDFIDELDYHVKQVQEFPYSCKVYQPVRRMNTQYRILPVKNYLVFYTVKEAYIEIQRIVYAKMDLENLIR